MSTGCIRPSWLGQSFFLKWTLSFTHVLTIQSACSSGDNRSGEILGKNAGVLNLILSPCSLWTEHSSAERPTETTLKTAFVTKSSNYLINLQLCEISQSPQVTSVNCWNAVEAQIPAKWIPNKVEWLVWSRWPRAAAFVVFVCWIRSTSTRTNPVDRERSTLCSCESRRRLNQSATSHSRQGRALDSLASWNLFVRIFQHLTFFCAAVRQERSMENTPAAP